MKHNAKRALSTLLALLMILSMLAGVVLPASAEDIIESTPYDQIATDPIEGSDALAPKNAVFVNPAFGSGEYVGTFTFTYGDGTTWGNGKTYQLTFGENAFKNLYEGVYKIRDTWNAADTTVAEYTGPDTVVIAPGTYGGNQWQKTEDVKYDLPSDWDNGAYFDLFTVNFIGPQAGVSPVTDEIDHTDPKPQNGRSADTSKEAVSTSTMWEPFNVQYIVDGVTMRGQANYYGRNSDEMPYHSLVLKNIYHHVDVFYEDGVFRGSGLKAARNMELLNYFIEYDQLIHDTKQTPTNQKFIATRFVMDNFYQDDTAIEYVNDQYAQGYQILCYPTATVNEHPGFLGKDVTGSYWSVTNTTVNNHATSHWLRFSLNDGSYATAAENSINITFRDNLFLNCGDWVRSLYDNKGTDSTADDVVSGKDAAATADNSSYTDTISFQNDWTMENKGALNFTFADNTMEYTLAAMNDAYDGQGGTKAKTTGGAFFALHYNNQKDINDQFVNWKMYDNTLIYPSESSLTSRIYLMAASQGSQKDGTLVKNDVWDYSHLMLNEKGEVCTFWGSYHTVNDLYAGDDFAGGVKELFTVVDGAEMAIAENDIVLRKANAANGLPVAGFEGTLMIVPETDAADYEIKDLFKFRGEKVEVVKLLNAMGQEVTGKVRPKDLDGCKVVAQYKGKTTVCTVTLTISIAPESEYAFIDPAGDKTSYEFNGKTYTLNSENYFTTFDRNYNENGAEVDSTYKKIKAAGKNVIVFLPGEHKITGTTTKGVPCDNFQFQYDAAILGPQFGVSPVADDFTLNPARDGLKKTAENSYTVDTTKEAYITGGCLNVYFTEAAIYMDGLSFANTEMNLQAANYSWGYAKNGSLTSITMNNAFVNGLDAAAFIGAWGNSRADMIAKQAVYMSDVYATGLNAEKATSLINVGAGNAHVDHVYVENMKTSCVIRTAASNGARMLIHPQVATLKVTDSKFTNINETYNFIYPNFGHNDPADKGTSWAGTVYAGDPDYFPGGYEQVYDNNIFENIASTKTWIVRATTPGTGDVYQRLQFTNNTVLYDAVPEVEGQDFYNPSAYGVAEQIVSGNVFINCVRGINVASMQDKSKTNIDENYFAVIENGVEKVSPITPDGEAEKSDWYYVDRAMTVKNTDLALVDKSYKAFEDNGFDGINNYVIDAMGTSGDVFKAVEGATVAGVYSDAACTQATQPATGTVYVLVKKGDVALANKVELTYCDHVGKGTTEEITKEPGCNTTGTKATKCAACGAVLSTEEIPATEQHVAKDELVVMTKPTCFQPGEGYSVCKFCNVSLEFGLPIPATGEHVYAEEWSKDATGHYHKCTTEGCTAKDNVIAHTESEIIVDTPATCYTEGVGHTECTECGFVINNAAVVPATNEHVWDTTLTQGETTHYYACTTDGCTAKNAEAEHAAGELIVDTAATCVATGIGHKDCVCGKTVESNIIIEKDADNHVGGTTVKDAKDATCGVKGYTGDTYCLSCNVKLSDGAETPATGKHSYDKGVVTKEPTTKAEGVKTFTCTVCGATKTEKIAKLAPKVSFNDVKKSDFYYDAVQWAVELGVTTGTGPKTFGPAEGCTRAQAVTFLWRAAGQPTAKNAKNPFTDVKKSDYYYKAVLWAAESGVTSGTSATKFSPNDTCTRGQIVTFLWRAQSGKKVSVKNPFTDVKKSDFYYNAVLWAVKNGVTTGTSSTTFGPAEKCTRGQIVTFLYRAVAK